MKKQEVRNLEDEFSTLFKPQQHQQSLSRHSDSNLLDSPQPSQKIISGTFKQLPINQSQSDDDFLDQIDSLLDNTPQDYQPTRREIMLNFKLNQLRLMCKNLKQANLQLSQRIEELEKSHSEASVDNTIQLNKSQDLTMMQQDFTELEEELAMYKQQLTKYQQQIGGQLIIKDEEIKKARQEIGELKLARDKAERELRERGRVISLLQERNEQLLLVIEDLQASQEPTIIQSNDNYFNEQISHQMEGMIDKLMKELKYEKRTNAKQLSEIKRLNSEIILLENKIKQKNQKIYEVQLAAIKLSKPQYSNSPKEKTSRRVDTDRDEQQYIGYPQRNFLGVSIQPNKNKTQTSFNVNKNRISAEREGAIVTKPVGYGSFLPLSKVFSTFTLMDLLNKEFKIRTAQKYFIASRVVQLYAEKLTHGNYDNLIPEEIQIYNFSSQNPSQLRVRANGLSRSDRYEASEESLLYNMGFVLDSLLNQVTVVDAYLGTILELNIPDYIELVLGKPSKEEKQKLLVELATSIERQYLND